MDYEEARIGFALRSEKSTCAIKKAAQFERCTGMGKTKIKNSQESSAITQVRENEGLNRALAYGWEDKVFGEAKPWDMGNLVKPDMQLSREKGNAAGQVGPEMKRKMRCLLLYIVSLRCL